MSSPSKISPRLLWLDLTHDQSSPDCMAAFADACQIKAVANLPASGLDVGQTPDMICIHYDRPDALGLDLLLQIKHTVPTIPITMLTVQHTEELAVWAFRSGVWDYLPLPLQPAELQRYLQALRELCLLRSSKPSQSKQPVQRACSLPESVRLTPQYQRQQPLLCAVSYIEEHFHEQIEQKTIAEHCGMTPFRFSRLFKQTFGMGYLEYILRKRMEKAQALLGNSQMPITSIAYAVGFQDPSYFARAFKQYFGYCPSHVRQEESPHSQFTLELTSHSAVP